MNKELLDRLKGSLPVRTGPGVIMEEPEENREQGGAEPREAHNLDPAGSTPAPASNPPDFRRFRAAEVSQEITMEVYPVKTPMLCADGKIEVGPIEIRANFRRFTMGELVPLKGMVFRVRGVDVSQGRQWLILEYQGITAKEERRLKLVKG